MSIPILFMAMIAVAVLAVAWNSYRLRKRLGDSPSTEDIRKQHPRAKVFSLWKPK